MSVLSSSGAIVAVLWCCLRHISSLPLIHMNEYKRLHMDLIRHIRSSLGRIIDVSPKWTFWVERWPSPWMSSLGWDQFILSFDFEFYILRLGVFFQPPPRISSPQRAHFFFAPLSIFGSTALMRQQPIRDSCFASRTIPLQCVYKMAGADGCKLHPSSPPPPPC